VNVTSRPENGSDGSTVRENSPGNRKTAGADTWPPTAVTPEDEGDLGVGASVGVGGRSTGVGVGGKTTGVGVGCGVAVGAGVAVGWGVGFGGKTIGVAVGRGVGNGGSTMGVGVNGMVTGEGVGWGVAVGAGVAVGKDASAVATLWSATRRMSSVELLQPTPTNRSPTNKATVNPLFTIATRVLSIDQVFGPGLLA